MRTRTHRRYNVIPPKAGLYFNKIQCFCFEEQQLQAHEEIEMPVFFVIDPEVEQDARFEDVCLLCMCACRRFDPQLPV